MNYDFITLGGSTEDIVFYTNEGKLIKGQKSSKASDFLAFKFGTKLKVDKSFSFFGGGASNAAVNFSKSGFKTAVITAVGSDYRGKEILANFKANKIDFSLAKKIKGANSSFSVFVIDNSGEYVAFVDRGVKKDLTLSAKDVKAIKKTKWLYITSLSANWKKILLEVKRARQKNDFKIAWNPGGLQLREGLKKLKPYMGLIDVFFVNKFEAGVLVGKKEKTLQNVKNLAKIIKNQGPGKVVITDGKRGAVCFDGQKFFQVKAEKGKAVDTTGVGDAFNSSFVIGLESGKDIEKSLRLAAKKASSVVAKQGAQNGL